MERVRPIRTLVQAAWGVLTNAYINGFLPGAPAIYQGSLKYACVPGLNCYSCPGALGSCPIGAMQVVFDGRQRNFAFYATGYIALVGLFLGRFVCGWLCPFGLIQELLHRVPVPKLKVPDRPDRVLRYMKYLILAVTVFAIPFLIRDQLGVGEPFFCEYICPVGTLEGGVPLVLVNSAMRSTLGWLFRWKFFLMILCLVASMVIYRPFCKYLCPLGAFYGLFQRVSLMRMRVDGHSCTDCGRCAAGCRMGVDPHKTPNSSECIRCRDCIGSCPAKALSMGIAQGSEIIKKEHNA